ncbi:MAG TPA: hypothetical protein VMK12_13230, partial [Anaeromyxobacteraceae bacterium]|nr:hypothetical protein [Anaeromyxobacteraceae bacterium]
SQFEVLTTGVGPPRAVEALRERLGQGPRPELVISSGFAGALTEGVELHAFVTASAVRWLVEGRSSPLRLPCTPRSVRGALPCQVFSCGKVVLGGALSGFSGPAAVDMESAALAEVAAGAAIPFAVLRLVTDTPASPISPLAIHAARALSERGVRRAGGTARLVLEAARDPARAFSFVRASRNWCALLRRGWRTYAAQAL